MSYHTPTPWRVQFDDDSFVITNDHDIESPMLLRVATASSLDAEHIVRCVNSHDDLLAALTLRRLADSYERMPDKELLSQIERQCRRLGYRGLESGDGVFLWDFIDGLADKTIANATGEQP